LRARRLAVFVPLVLALAAGATVTGNASGVAASCASSYSYAGFDNSRHAHGITAVLTPMSEPTVERGHVAAWIGVGGIGLGPHHLTEWLQVGLSAGEGATSSNLYYEVARPHDSARFTAVLPTVAVGESHKVAVLELTRRPSWWRVWVDHEPVTAPIYLPGSHGSWEPQALGESWNDGSRACNTYAYRFDRLYYAKHPGGSWRKFEKGVCYDDPGYVSTRERGNHFLVAARSLAAIDSR
jgi:hypothetical protein